MTVNHIVLFEPQIPANTGNIARTCAATNSPLHLIEPLGFSTDDKHLKRAGLDYWHDVDITYHKSLEAFLEYLGERPLYLITKFANHTYDEVDLARDEEQFFMFGKETTGLPEEFMRRKRREMLASSDERYACAFIEFIEYGSDCRVRSASPTTFCRA